MLKQSVFLMVIVEQLLCGYAVYYHFHDPLRPLFVRNYFKQDSDNSGSSSVHPYHATLIIENTVICSGALVSKKIIITSAQCVSQSYTIQVYLGTKKLSEIGDFTTPLDVIIHEDYKFLNFQLKPDNDIALIKIDLPENDKNDVEPIRMPKLSERRTFDYYKVYVTGWGRGEVSEDLSGPVRNNLITSTAMAITNSVCTSFHGPIINERHVCLKVVTVTSCFGDLGSPLAIVEDDGLHTLIGIASFGSWAGCETQSPQVFTRITSYLTWLHSHGVPERLDTCDMSTTMTTAWNTLDY